MGFLARLEGVDPPFREILGDYRCLLARSASL